jgi:hypothetical protein
MPLHLRLASLLLLLAWIPALAQDDSDDTPKDGWRHTVVELSTSTFRASDTTHVRTATLSLDLSKSWRSGIISLSPSLSLQIQRNLVKDTSLRSATGQLLGSVSPTSWLTFVSAGYYTVQGGENDYGGYGKVKLSHSLGAHLDGYLTGSVSDDHLGTVFPSAALSIGQDFEPFEWSLDGNWSYQSVGYSITKLRSVSNAKGGVRKDTIDSDTSKYISEWGAGLSMRVKGESWGTGPFVNYTLQWAPLGTDVIAVKNGAGPVTRKSQSATAKNQTIELGWNGTISPKDWLDIDLSISNVWAKQDISLTRKGALAVSRAQLNQRVKYLQDKSTPPAVGLNISLGATVDF